MGVQARHSAGGLSQQGPCPLQPQPSEPGNPQGAEPHNHAGTGHTVTPSRVALLARACDRSQGLRPRAWVSPDPWFWELALTPLRPLSHVSWCSSVWALGWPHPGCPGLAWALWGTAHCPARSCGGHVSLGRAGREHGGGGGKFEDTAVLEQLPPRRKTRDRPCLRRSRASPRNCS